MALHLRTSARGRSGCSSSIIDPRSETAAWEAVPTVARFDRPVDAALMLLPCGLLERPSALIAPLIAQMHAQNQSLSLCWAILSTRLSAQMHEQNRARPPKCACTNTRPSAGATECVTQCLACGHLDRNPLDFRSVVNAMIRQLVPLRRLLSYKISICGS